MAQFLLVSVLVHTPPSGSSFIANDVVNAYWDDSTSTITVTKNGSPYTYTSASQIGIIGTNYHVSNITSYEGEYAISGYSFCNSTTLNWFRMLTDYPMPPYMGRVQTANSPVCDVGGGAVCDIHFTSARVVTPTTSLTNPNGSFTTTAESSNGVVKYALFDFDYATEGQTSGTFSGLNVGTLYNLYVKDPNDCTLHITFSVWYEPSENEHYRFTWSSVLVQNGTSHDARLRIYEREYVGDVVEVPYGDTSPFTLNKPKQGGPAGVNDKFFPIHPTNATLVLKSQNDYQFLPLFTQDNKKYKCVYEVDEGAGFTPIWSGFIVPSVYREDFIATPYSVEILIADNVATLKDEPFTDDSGGLLTGDIKIIKVISHIMKKTGLDLNIRSGVNIFESNHNTTATDDPLDQTYVDVSCYRDGGKSIMCWDVLERILRPFGARIFQYDNNWIIEEIDGATTTYAYRLFTSGGVYSSNSTFNPILDIKASTFTNRVALVDQDHSMEVIPAYGKIDVVSKLNYVGSIVSGGFEKDDLLSPDSETFVISQGIFTSEEDFNGWTLRIPSGVSGVSFGRIVVGQRGDSARTGFKTENEDLTRSVGAFYYNSAWGGNLRDAYIESAAKPYQYGPNDEFNFRFEYSTPAKPEFAFMVLRFMIKLGSQYLQQDLTWGATEHIYRNYPKVSNSIQNFELSVSLPDTTSIVDTTVQIRIYFYASEFYDCGLPPATADPDDGTDGQMDLDNITTVDIDYDYRLDIRLHESVGSVTNHFRAFLELAYSTAAESFQDGIFHVGDYNATTNPKIWRNVGQVVLENNPVGNRRGIDSKFYIDNVVLDALVNGQPPPSEETISLQISEFINEDLEIELFNFDVPDIVNAKNMYNNYFKLSDGTPTSAWARSGISESLTLQQILLKVLGANHSAPTFRLTGSFINEFSRIGINNYLKLIKPGSSLVATNTTFTSNLSGWTGDASGTAFAWTADNSGSAEVVLSGLVNSEKLYQSINHSGGYIQFTVNIHAIPTAGNDREDQLWVLFYNGLSIIHTERMQTFAALSSDSDFDFTYIAFAPGQVTKIGFFIRRINGSGDCTYQFGEFTPAGIDIEEIYLIADYQQDERQNRYTLELMQLSKAYISLSGVDQGGNNQGGGVNEGSAFSGAYSSAYGGAFDTVLN